MAFSARFDDLAGAGKAWRFDEPLGEVVARRTDEVAGALGEVERAARDGCWAAGFVTYEAAPGLEPAMVVPGVEATTGGVAAALPLVWFGLFKTRRAVAPVPPLSDGFGAVDERWSANVTEAEHAAAVDRIRRHIAAGDSYQVNYGIRLRTTEPGRDLYARMCHAQRGAYSAHLDTGRFEVACASPELFFATEGRVLQTKPMKGTARRGRWCEEDAAFREALATSDKDRAENLMIVDLLRNDVGRVATVGSVRVEELFQVERYETVWQLTSTISGRLGPATGLPALFAALFPCGSVTGAPKIRTMRIIADLEAERRGVFCGAVGYVGPPAPVDGAAVTARFAVGIRTVVVDHHTGLAEYGVGSGITWGSDPASEYRELGDKSTVLTARRPEFALLETIAYDPTDGLRHGALHCARMAASAAYFGFAWDHERIADALKEATAGVAEARRVRVTVTRDGRPAVTLAPLPAAAPEPVRLALDPEPIDRSDPFVFHKTTNRAGLDRRRQRHPGVDDVLLVNEQGELTESTIANLAAELDGRWFTPPLSSGCLPGVARAALLAEGRLAERVLHRDDLARASGLALVNSLRGWRAAVLVG